MHDVVTSAALAAATAAAVLIACWAVAGSVAFRQGESDELGSLFSRGGGLAVVTALLLAIVTSFARARFPYVPSPLAIGVLGGGLAVCVLTDVRAWRIYNSVLVVVFAAGFVVALYNGRLTDLFIGLAAAGFTAFVGSRMKILGAADVKLAAVAGSLLGGSFGVVAVAAAVLALAVAHGFRQMRSPVPITTRAPWAPFLAFGVVAAVIVAASPAAGFLAASAP